MKKVVKVKRIVKNEIRPSKEMWDYYTRTGSEITVDLILSSLADRLNGNHISYSATELLKDLDLLAKEKDSSMRRDRVNKLGRQVLSRELHNRFHSYGEYYKIINPNPVVENPKTAEPKLFTDEERDIIAKEWIRDIVAEEWMRACVLEYPNFNVEKFNKEFNLEIFKAFAHILKHFEVENLEKVLKENTFIKQKIIVRSEYCKDRKSIFHQPATILIYFLAINIGFQDFDNLYPYETNDCRYIFSDMGISTLS